MAIIFGLLFSVLGGIFRRFWGGWLNMPYKQIVKITTAGVLGLVCGWFAFTNVLSAPVFAIWIIVILLNPWHSKGQGMGVPTGSPSLVKSIMWMSGTYGAFTLAAALSFCVLETSLFPLGYAIMGFLTSIPYLFGWYVTPKFMKVNANYGYIKPFLKLGKNADGTPSYFLDSVTGWGEIGIGILTLGGAFINKELSAIFHQTLYDKAVHFLVNLM